MKRKLAIIGGGALFILIAVLLLLNRGGQTGPRGQKFLVSTQGTSIVLVPNHSHDNWRVVYHAASSKTNTPIPSPSNK